MTKLVFLDTETTSLDADTGEIWEVGLITRGDHPQPADIEFRYLVKVDLTTADPMSLQIGRFHDRHPHGNNEGQRQESTAALDPADVARQVAYLTHGAHLVGNVVSFDEERLRKLLPTHGHQPSWNYHLVDVEALVAGKLGLAPPWKSPDLSEAIGVPLPDEADRHTALGDARWARDLYDAVMGSDR